MKTKHIFLLSMMSLMLSTTISFAKDSAVTEVPGYVMGLGIGLQAGGPTLGVLGTPTASLGMTSNQTTNGRYDYGFKQIVAAAPEAVTVFHSDGKVTSSQVTQAFQQILDNLDHMQNDKELSSDLRSRAKSKLDQLRSITAPKTQALHVMGIAKRYYEVATQIK